MKNLKQILKLVLVLIFIVKCKSVDINNILSRMSIEEKCGQMTLIAVDLVTKSVMPTNPDENPLDYEKLYYAIVTKKIGAIYYVPIDKALKGSTWQKMINLIQDVALNQTNGIPVLYGSDAVHGATYIIDGILFPQPIGVSATFNANIARRIGEITAFEMRAIGIPWNLNQIYELGRQPLWARLYETYGEDVYLTSKMIESFVKGAQGDALGNDDKIASTMKHFIGYGFPLNGLDRTPAWIEENILRELYLPAYETGIKSGVKILIVNSGEVNSIPGHINSHYINHILKGELNYDGIVVSDWGDIENLYTRDKVVVSQEEAVRKAVMSGIDVSMVPLDFSFGDICVNLANTDENFLKRVNNAVARILKVKNDLGILRNPYPSPQSLKMIGLNESHAFNLEAARESIILAKNENNILPLNSSLRLLVTGAAGNIIRVFNGGSSYTWQGVEEEYYNQFGSKKYSIFEAIQLKTNNTSLFSEGANFTDLTNINETLNLTRFVDLIVLCIGEDSYAEGIGNIDSLLISESQSILAEKLAETGKPIVVVYIGGRPRVITKIVNNAHAVLLGFLPGNKAGEAIADILFGDYNPNGRLPITYPKNTNGFNTYDCKSSETYNYLFPFGHGLSYTQFSYFDLKLNSSIVYPMNGLSAYVRVKNVGTRSGKETVLLYLNDELASITRPVKQLKGFHKISLEPNQEVLVEFELTFEDLSFIKNNMRIVENGYFTIYVSNLTTRFLVADSSTETQPTFTSSTRTTTTTTTIATTTKTSTTTTARTSQASQQSATSGSAPFLQLNHSNYLKLKLNLIIFCLLLLTTKLFI